MLGQSSKRFVAVLLANFVVLALFAATPVQKVWAADSKAAAKPSAASSDKSSSADTQTTSGDSGVQGYAADSAIEIGSIVQLTSSGSTKVSVSTKADVGHMYGVTVDRQKIPLTITDSGLKNEVFVATAGTYDTLVSSQNGPIKAGQYVTLSAINGVAMKAGEDDATVFGRAAASFDGKNNAIGKATLKDTAGKQTGEVTIGLIPVSIDVRRNPDQKSTKTNLPIVLQRIGQAIADKPISPLRIYLSIAITCCSLIAAIVVLYSGVRSSIISIGRNPLSKKSIFRGLLEVVFTGLLILIIGLFAVYLLLKL